MPGAVRASVEGGLQRLGVNSVTLLQLHNSLTRQRGDQPTSLTPADVLRPGGVRDAFEQLRMEGLVHHLGLTGLGDAESLRAVLAANAWAALQVNLNLCAAGPDSGCFDGWTEPRPPQPARLAIRVFAGGALAGKPPSAHTLTTKFFPLAGYERDLRRAGFAVPHDGNRAAPGRRLERAGDFGSPLLIGLQPRGAGFAQRKSNADSQAWFSAALRRVVSLSSRHE